MDTSTALQTKRGEFNRYNAEVVLPLLGLSETEQDNIGFTATARRLSDPAVRRQYCQLAAAMLEANIAHHRADASYARPLETPRGHGTVVATTLLAAAAAYYFGGTLPALLLAAVWYWLASKASSRRAEQSSSEARTHNEHVADWAKTVRDWEAERAELLSLAGA